MILYAESSAAVAWLLTQSPGAGVGAILGRAEHVVVSDLLFVECDRACIRAETLGTLLPERLAAVRTRLARVATRWETMSISASVIERARRPFPVEPVRSLDAIHLATALELRIVAPEVQFLSLDKRVLENAVRLGFEVMPARE